MGRMLLRWVLSPLSLLHAVNADPNSVHLQLCSYSYAHVDLWWKEGIDHSSPQLTTTLNGLNSLLAFVLWPGLNFWDLHKFYKKFLYKLTEETH